MMAKKNREDGEEEIFTRHCFGGFGSICFVAPTGEEGGAAEIPVA